MKIAILASGNGTNAQAIIDSIKQDKLKVQVAAIISNNQNARVLERANRENIPARFIDPKAFADRHAYDRELLAAVRRFDVDCICLAGYMLLLTSDFLQGFAGPILNIHPSLLPAFPGTHGTANAQAYGVKITGVTVHFVSEEMDMGPVIIQAALPLPDNAVLDQFMASVHAIEHRIYPQAIQWLAENRIVVEGRRTRLLPGKAQIAPQLPNCLVWPPLEGDF